MQKTISPKNIINVEEEIKNGLFFYDVKIALEIFHFLCHFY